MKRVLRAWFLLSAAYAYGVYDVATDAPWYATLIFAILWSATYNLFTGAAVAEIERLRAGRRADQDALAEADEQIAELKAEVVRLRGWLECAPTYVTTGQYDIAALCYAALGGKSPRKATEGEG